MHKRKKREHGIFYSSYKEKINKGLRLQLLFFPFWIAIFCVIIISYGSKPAYSTAGIKQSGNAGSKSHTAAEAAALEPLNSSGEENAVYNAVVGFSLYEDGLYPGAADYLEKEPPEVIANPYLSYMIASAYFKINNFKNSYAYIENAVKTQEKIEAVMPGEKKPAAISNSLASYLILKAKIEAGRGDLAKSIKTLKYILAKKPNNLKALLIIADIYLYEKDFNTASYYLNIAKLNHTHDIRAYLALSEIYAETGKFKKSRENLKQIITIDPYFKEAYFRLAAMYILEGKEKKAVSVFDKYLLINPYSKTALYQSGIVEYAIKNYASSRNRFDRFLYITRNSANVSDMRNNAWFFIGISHILQKNNSMGIHYLDKLVPGRRYIDANLQEIELYINDFKKTGDISDKEIIKKKIDGMILNKKVKKTLKLYYFSTIALSEIKDYAGAERVIKSGLRIFPGNTALLYQLGSVYHVMKNENKALAVMNEIVSKDPYNADALNYIGYHLALINRHLEKAEKMLIQALSYDKKSPYIMDSLGFVYFRQKKYSKALPLFRAAAKKLPGSATVLRHTGMAYFMLKNYPKASEYLVKSEKIKKTKETEKYIGKLKQIQIHSIKPCPASCK